MFYHIVHIREIIKQYCCFPKSILETHCKKMNMTLETISREDVPALAQRLGQAVERFTTPEKGKKTQKRFCA